MKKPAVFGKYLLLERLNVGGMAEVFIAKAFGVEGFERILAIKKILPTMAEDEEFIKMFIDEARISVQLNHANIVHIHELGNYDGTFFIAMEYVAGRDLRTILERYRKRKERMPAAQASFIASRMCEGLDYAHRKKDARGVHLGIIHRDVSPQNILCSYDGEVKIIDFGIAKAANRSQHTQAGILKGKFGYMSPEQVRGLPIDHRSDIFAVGVILYEMLTGEKLFVGESDFSTLEKVRNAEVTPPSRLNPGIPSELERVVLKALAREAEDRYQWPSDLQEDLMRFLVSGDAIYSNKQLGSFMREAFAEDVLREAEKMERFASVERPEQMELSVMGKKPSITGRRPAGGREITVPPSTRARSRSGDSLGAGGRGPTAKVTAQDTSPGRGDGDDVPMVLADDVEELTPGAATRTEMSPLLADPDDDGSEPKTAIDASLSDPAPMLGDSTGSYPTAPSMDALGEEPRTATATGNDRGQEIAAALSAALGDGTKPRTVSGKGPVVIGKVNGYRGATMVGPPPDGAEEDGAGAGYEDGPPRLEPEPPSVSTDAGVTMPPKLEPPRARKSPPKPRLRASRGEDEEREDLPAGRSRAPLFVLLGLLAAIVVGGYAYWQVQGGSTPTSGLLVMETSPEGVTLALAGKPMPKGEVFYVAPGEYELTAESPGYEPQSQRVVVEADAVRQLKIQLKPALSPREPELLPGAAPAAAPGAEGTPGAEGAPAEAAPEEAPPPAPATFSASFDSRPPGAEIRLEGNLVGNARVRAGNLQPDREYRYTARLAGYEPFEGTFKGDGKSVIEVEIKLKKEAAREPPRERERERERARSSRPPPVVKAKGKLACSSNPAGAEVIVNNKPTGRQTPIPIAKPLELPVGPHKVVFRLGNKQSKVHSVDIKENEVFTLRNIPLE